MSNFRKRRKRRGCSFCQNKVTSIDYKDTKKVQRYLTERGKILPRRVSGNCAKHQRMVTQAVKRARIAALIPFIND